MEQAEKSPSRIERVRRRRYVIKSFEREARATRSAGDAFADGVTYFFGSTAVIFTHALFFGGWIVINSGLIQSVQPFDPFPFNFLTLVVSLEAIFLSIFVLTNQRRQSETDDLRQEVDLNVDLIAEEEITKILKLMAGLYKHLGIPAEKDSELSQMIQPLRSEEIEA